MDVRSRDLDALQRIQEIDLEIRKLERELDDLPQREVIAQLRAKRSAIEEQNEKIEKLRRASKQKLSRIEDEDASLAKKEAGVQAAIEAAHGDFRNVTARSRELENVSNRRETLLADHERVESELERLSELSSQATATIATLSAQENAAMTTFKEEGGRLKAAISQRELNRREVASSVDKNLLARYEKIAAQTGGVAIGHLEDARCGVCHVTMEPGRLITLRAEAPLGQCPSCKRLLIIEPAEKEEQA